MATFGWQTHIKEEPFTPSQKSSLSSSRSKKSSEDPAKPVTTSPVIIPRSRPEERHAVPKSMHGPQDGSSRRRIPVPSHQSIAATISMSSALSASSTSRTQRSRLSQTAPSRLPAKGLSLADFPGDHHLRRRDRTIDAYPGSVSINSPRMQTLAGASPSLGSGLGYQPTATHPDNQKSSTMNTRPTSINGRLPSKSASRSRSQTESYDAFILPSAAPQKLDTSDLPPPMPTFSANSSSSRSTRQSECSGVYSGTSTPTSMSSASPQLSLPPSRNAGCPPSPVKRFMPTTVRSRSTSVTKVTTLQPPTGMGLQVVRESSYSSSSGSTVKAREKSPEIGSAIDISAAERQSKFVPSHHGGDWSAGLGKPNTQIPTGTESFRTNFSRPIPHSTPSPSQETLSALQRPPSRPRRPSDAILEAPIRPVIQTNIPSSVGRTPHRRKSSNTTAASTSTTSLGPISTAPSIPPSLRSIPSRIPSRNPSPVPSQASSSLSTSSNIPEVEKRRQRVIVEKRPPPAKSSSTSLRGLFGRKASPVVTTADAKSTKLRKPARGPTAGTGHEAYYRGTLRDRSGSVTSAHGPRPRGSSSSSRADAAASRKGSFETSPRSEFAEFMESRQSPVYMRGRGGSEASHSDLNLTLSPSGGSSMSTRLNQPLATVSAVDIRTQSFDHRQVEPCKTNPNQTHPTLATRRSQHRSQYLDLIPGPIPTPIKTSIPVNSPSINSQGTGGSSAIPMTGSSYMEWDDEPKKLTKEKKPRKPIKSDKPEKPDKAEKSSKGLRSFFSRARHKYSKTPTSEDFADEPFSGSQLAHFPHYALPYNSDELRQDPFENQLRPSLDRADHSYMPQEIPIEEYSAMVDQHEQALSALSRDSHSIVAGARDSESTTPVPETLNQFDGNSETPQNGLTRKPSRLQPLGRIPQVVSTWGKAAPADSIFARAEVLDIEAGDDNLLRVPARPSNMDLSDSSQPDTEFEEDMPEEKGAASAQQNAQPIRDSRQLPAPGPYGFVRKFSSAGCSSNGDIDFIAVPPGRGTPLSEDEVWPEYDGLLSYVASSKTAPVGHPIRREFQALPEYPSVAGIIAKRNSDEEAKQGHDRVEEYLDRGTPNIRASIAPREDHPHRRGKLSVPNGDARPQTQLSFSSFYAGYGERDQLATDAPAVPSPSIYSQPSEFSRPVSTASVITGKSNRKSTPRVSRVVKDGLDSEMSVRLGAMTASKWFTYGKVLFSPVLDQINNSRPEEEQRILVIDGLGLDDWSFFCAMDCKCAIVYNLNPGSSAPKNPPDNYRHVGYMPASGKFPFAGGYFAAVIYRFPLVTSGSQYKQTISECKRVLQPGGYIEVSLVDLDMTNMGSKMTRVLRQLKTKMQALDPQLSLTPLSDNIKQLLKRRGFENLKTATLRPPVAGAISMPSSARSSPDKQLSKADAEISRMIPNVCRWWYSRCYERIICDEPEESGQSIWHDEALLRECDRHDTNFRLLVAYAQKPIVNKRRTISV